MTKKQGFFANAKEQAATQTKLTYLYGGKYDKSKEYNVFIAGGNFVYGLHNIPVENLRGVSMKREDQVQEHMKSRLTVTRMALLGPLALAAPKRKIQKNITVTQYLLIDYIDENGPATIVFSGDNSQRMMNTLRNYIPEEYMSEQQSRNGNSFTDSEDKFATPIPEQNDPYEEVKKLKELLDLGIINTDEFEHKKKELLNL